ALKQILEQDEADKKVSTALLGMARLYTKTIDDSVESRLYVNVESRVIKALLAASGEQGVARRNEAARLLQSVAGLMAGRDEKADADVAENLTQLSAAVLALLG